GLDSKPGDKFDAIGGEDFCAFAISCPASMGTILQNLLDRLHCLRIVSFSQLVVGVGARCASSVLIAQNDLQSFQSISVSVKNWQVFSGNGWLSKPHERPNKRCVLSLRSDFIQLFGQRI